MKLHHIGVVCRDIEEEIKAISRIHTVMERTPVVYDPEQKATLSLLTLADGTRIELITGERVEAFLKRNITYYHLCFEVEDIDAEIRRLVGENAILLSSPKNALLFGNRKVAFLQVHKAGKSVTGNILLGVGLAQGLGFLLYYKYFASFLPLGLSFYTFKTISYLLDIRKGKIRPSRDWVVFFSYVAFFPCLVAGPIDQPGLLIPQLEKKRVFDYGQASDGMRQILWGLFKKVVIADNCGAWSGEVFSHYRELPASALLYGAFLNAIWLYADFSGYSDMAIGYSRLLGFSVTRNFNFPFFARNIADFWRRWHISLTSWMTEYVFTPLAIYFRDYGKPGLLLAILINFILIGMWHGPHRTFVYFGLLNGCYFIPLVWRGTLNKKGKGNGLARVGTFILVMLTFVIFRSGSMHAAVEYYHRLFTTSLIARFYIEDPVFTSIVLACIVLLFAAEWLQRDRQHALQIDVIKWFPVRALIYTCLILLILAYGPTRNADFIYIKF